jgi:hypothetical protein
VRRTQGTFLNAKERHYHSQRAATESTVAAADAPDGCDVPAAEEVDAEVVVLGRPDEIPVDVLPEDEPEPVPTTIIPFMLTPWTLQ